MAKIKDIATQIRGVSYHPEDLHDTLDENSVILLRANNIKDGKLILDDAVYVSKSKVAKQQYLQTGDILICASSGSKELVGKAAFVDSVKNPMTFGAFCKVVRPQPEYSEYLGHYFNSPVYRRKISALSAGANINNIKNEHIDNLDIQLVDEKERREIITILNELNMLISLRKRQLEKLDELVRARFVEMFGDLDSRPKQKIKDITKRVKVGFVGTCEKYYTNNSEIPMLRTTNITAHGIDLKDLKYVTKEFHEKNPKSQVHAGDLLIARHGANGQANAYYGREAQCLNAIIIEPDINITNSIFLEYLINSIDVKSQINKKLVGSTQHVLNTTTLANVEVSIPEMREQQTFSAFVERVNQQKQTVQQSLEKLEVMKKALMQEYFG